MKTKALCCEKMNKENQIKWSLLVLQIREHVWSASLILSSSNSADIFELCETFLNSNIDDITLNNDGYRFERKDRENCNLIPTDKGGAIVIYLANHINYVRRQDL